MHNHRFHDERDLTGVFLTKKTPEEMVRKDMITFAPAAPEVLQKQMDLTAEQVAALPDGFIAGFASTADLDRVRDVVLAGAFDDSIKERGLTGPRGIKLLIGHDSEKLAGVITKLETRDGKLWIEARLNLEIGYVKDAYLAAKMIGGVSFSVGFRILDYTFKEDEERGIEYLEIAKGDLLEVSMVPFPANEHAQMMFIKSHDEFPNFGSLAELCKALAANRYQVTSRNAADALVKCVKRLVLKEPEARVVTAREPDYSKAIALARSVPKPQMEQRSDDKESQAPPE